MRLKLSLTLLLIIFPVLLFSQNDPKIGPPEVSFFSDTLKVVYDIGNCKAGSVYDIDLKIFYSDGTELRASSLSGDIGKSISCGNSKTIYWDMAKDNIQLNDDIEIEIIAKQIFTDEPVRGTPEKTNSSLTRGKIIASSLLLPGLGQKKAKGKSGPLVLGVVGYGSLAAIVYFALEGKKSYDLYLDETEQSYRDDHFTKSEDSYEMMKVSAIAAAGVWTANMIWAAFVPYEKNQNMVVGVVPAASGGIELYARWTF